MDDNVELKIKFTQVDLTDKSYIYRKMTQHGSIFNNSLIYNNSGFISRLNTINRYYGGAIATIAKHEDNIVPETEFSDRDENSPEPEYTMDGRHYEPNDYFVCYDSDDEYDGEMAEYDYDDEYYDDDIDDALVDALLDEFDNYGYSDDDNPYGIKVEFNTTGKISELKNQITITYGDGELTGIQDSIVNIMMDSKNPDIITIQRDNFMGSTITLEKNKRSISSNCDSNFPAVTFAVRALQMVNSMTEKGGEINLLYTIEANGSPTEMVSYSLSAQKKSVD